MGQYYRAIVKKQNRRITVYNRYIMRGKEKEYDGKTYRTFLVA